MRTIADDTSLEIERIQIEGYRRMSPRQKLQQVSGLTRAVQQMALARLRVQYPGATERELQLRLASLWLDRDTMVRVFDWDPRQKGY
jgi:hypothetical protein